MRLENVGVGHSEGPFLGDVPGVRAKGVATGQARSEHFRSSGAGGGTSREDGGCLARPRGGATRRKQRHKCLAERFGRQGPGGSGPGRRGNAWGGRRLWQKEDFSPNATQQELGTGSRIRHRVYPTPVGAQGLLGGGGVWMNIGTRGGFDGHNTGMGLGWVRLIRRSRKERGEDGNRGRERGSMAGMEGRLRHCGG